MKAIFRNVLVSAAIAIIAVTAFHVTAPKCNKTISDPRLSRVKDVHALVAIIADGSGQERRKAMDNLVSLLQTSNNELFLEYADCDVLGPIGSSHQGVIPSRKHRLAVLDRAITRLVESADGDVNNPASWILSSLRPFWPEPKQNIEAKLGKNRDGRETLIRPD